MPSDKQRKQVNTKKPVMLRHIDPDLWIKVKVAAMRDGQTVSEWVSDLFKRAVANGGGRA